MKTITKRVSPRREHTYKSHESTNSYSFALLVIYLATLIVGIYNYKSYNKDTSSQESLISHTINL
jgi:hypothetical protein